MPKAIMIAGCNGAGKTTNAPTILQKYDCDIFINPDELAFKLCPQAPVSVQIKAGKLMLQLIQQSLKWNRDFAFECTGAGKNFVSILQNCKAKGYETILYYFWLANPQEAVARVEKRVLSEGHNVDRETIIRRHERSVNNIFELYLPIVDKFYLLNSGVELCL